MDDLRFQSAILFQHADLGAPGDQLQTLGDPLEGLLVRVAAMPGAVTLLVGPVGPEPELIRMVPGTQDFHPQEARGIVHEVGAPGERIADCLGHAAVHPELAENDNHARPPLPRRITLRTESVSTPERRDRNELF